MCKAEAIGAGAMRQADACARARARTCTASAVAANPPAARRLCRLDRAAAAAAAESGGGGGAPARAAARPVAWRASASATSALPNACAAPGLGYRLIRSGARTGRRACARVGNLAEACGAHRAAARHANSHCRRTGGSYA